MSSRVASPKKPSLLTADLHSSLLIIGIVVVTAILWAGIFMGVAKVSGIPTSTGEYRMPMVSRQYTTFITTTVPVMPEDLDRWDYGG